MQKILLTVAAIATIKANETLSQVTRPIVNIPTNFRLEEKVYNLDANGQISTLLRTLTIGYLQDENKVWLTGTEATYPYVSASIFFDFTTKR